MNQFSVVGKSVPRVDGVPKATGDSKYAADLWKPGCLCGRILRSPHPHARIVNVDTTLAQRVPGVRAIPTAADVPQVRFGQFIFDETLFKGEKVRYIGDEVAALAAIDEDAAQEALDRIQVEYEELPAVFDPDEALKPGAPLIHEDFAEHQATFAVVGREGNQCCRIRFQQGDAALGFSQADEVIENRFTTHAQHPTYLETHAALADCDSSGNLTIWLTTQSVYKSQEVIAKLLDLPLSRVRVIGTAVGGGFGRKKPRVEHYAAALAHRTRKPVRIVLNREEDFAVTFKRHPAVMDIKSGVEQDGTLTAWELKMVTNTGAYADHGPCTAAFGSFHGKGPYRTPHVNVEARVVYTNQCMSGAFRGDGNPQVAFAVESQMDIIARTLGMDPLELRRKNAMAPGDTLLNGQRYGDVRLRETLDQAAEAFGWARPRPSVANGKKRGVGMACGSHPTAGMGSSALIKLMADGTVQVLTGFIEIGAGEHTVAAQVAAETMSVSYEKVRIVAADTDATPFEHYTAGSRSTFNLGHVISLAAEDARRELIRRAAEMLEANPEDLRAEQEQILIASAPDRRLTYAEVARAANVRLSGPIIGKASYLFVPPPVTEENVEGSALRPYAAHGYVTHIAEVEVDEETGEVNLLRMVCSHDVGQAINRGGLEGQIEGGVAQGIGYTLVKEMRFDGGVLTNGTLVDYKIPNILDVPPIEYHFIELGEPNGPFGAKGVAESVLVPTAPAIANAVYDAVGVRIKDLPITPEKLLRTLSDQRS